MSQNATMLTHKQFHSLLDDLIVLNLLNRSRVVGCKEILSPTSWAREFCTISCDIGRRTGKSEYIKTRANKGDLLVVATPQVRHCVFPTMLCTIATPELVKNLQQTKFNTIFVDEPSLVFRLLERETLYKYLAHDGEQTFIMLGS